MKLYEIITGHTGESYVRSYCWAASEQRARELFAAVAPKYGIAAVRELLSVESAEFCTVPNDHGWPG